MPTLILMHGMTGNEDMMRHSQKKYALKVGHFSFQKGVLPIQPEAELGGDTKIMIPIQLVEPTFQRSN